MPDGHGKMTEEEAIAEVVRLGRETDDASTAQTAWYAFRIGAALAGLGLVSLLILFAFTVMDKSGGIPVGALIMCTIAIAGGAAIAFWGHQNSSKDPE